MLAACMTVAAVGTIEASEPHHITMSIDPTFTSTEQQLIREAADRWNDITDSRHKIKFSSKSRAHIANTSPGPGLDGRYEDGNIMIRPNLTSHRFLTVATHEFGHALGIDHIPHGLMNARGEDPYLTQNDLIECQRIHVCPSS